MSLSKTVQIHLMGEVNVRLMLLQLRVVRTHHIFVHVVA